MSFFFGDAEPDDAYAAGDTLIEQGDDSHVGDLIELEQQMVLIATVRDDDARLQLAKRWAKALNGEGQF